MCIKGLILILNNFFITNFASIDFHDLLPNIDMLTMRQVTRLDI